MPTQKNPEIEISNPIKSFHHPCHLKSGVPPPPTRAINPLSPKTDQHQSPRQYPHKIKRKDYDNNLRENI